MVGMKKYKFKEQIFYIFFSIEISVSLYCESEEREYLIGDIMIALWINTS